MNVTPVTKPIVASEPNGIAGINSSRPSFSDIFNSAVSQVEGAQETAKSAAMDLLADGKGDVHNVALATQRADLSLELFQQVRNKFVSAYQEIMKMPM